MVGLLDATNAVQSSVSVITPIDSTTRNGSDLPSAKLPRKRQESLSHEFQLFPRRSERKPKSSSGNALRNVTRLCNSLTTLGRKRESRCGVEHQKMNAALAIAALQATAIQVSADATARGLSSVEWPARFQIWNERIVIDGAHNPASARILAQTWQEEFDDEHATILLAILRDKNAPEIVQAFAPIATRFVLLQFGASAPCPRMTLPKYSPALLRHSPTLSLRPWPKRSRLRSEPASGS